MRIGDLTTDFYFHLGLVFPDMQAPVRDLKRLTSKIDEAGLDYTRSAFAPSDAVFEQTFPDSQEKTTYRVTQKFLAVSHFFVNEVQFEAFCKIVETFIPIVTETFRIPTFLSQEFFVRKLAACPDGQDALGYISGAVLGLREGQMGSFQRPPSGLGLRLYFGAEQANPIVYDVKIETFLRDASRVFLENHARFLQPLPASQPGQAVDRLRQTRSFLEEKVLEFIQGPDQYR